MHPRVQFLIDELQLQPHPEGGYYRELYRSATAVQPLDGRDRRAALTTIYFLLPAGAHSRWHRVASDEVWHWYEGGSLELLLADPPADTLTSVTLTPAALHTGPVHTVPAGWWQAARPLGDYAFVGCTVGPGFEFADFSFLRDAPQQAVKVQAARPLWAALL